MQSVNFLLGFLSGYRIFRALRDPFDPGFASHFVPQLHDFPPIADDPSLPREFARAANDALSHGARALAYLEGVEVSINRLQSAFQLGQDAAATLQDGALTGFLDAAADELNRLSSSLDDVRGHIEGSSINFSVTQTDVYAFLDDPRVKGADALPAQERELFARFGLDQTTQSQVILVVLGVDPASVPLVLSEVLKVMADAAKRIAQRYEHP